METGKEGTIVLTKEYGNGQEEKKKEKRNCSFNFGDLKCEFVSPVM